MERVCRACGRVYRGLVCQACHPRGSRKRRGQEIEDALESGERMQSAGLPESGDPAAGLLPGTSDVQSGTGTA